MLNRIRRLLGRPELHHVPEVRFVCEQDGAPERELKAKLRAPLEQRPLVERAYLAQVAYAGTPRGAVALCLVGPQDGALASAIGAEFARQFANGVPLDSADRQRPTDLTLRVRSRFATRSQEVAGMRLDVVVMERPVHGAS